jgi:hypothetical protein
VNIKKEESFSVKKTDPPIIEVEKSKDNLKPQKSSPTKEIKINHSRSKKLSDLDNPSPNYDETYVNMDKDGNMLVTSLFIDGKYVVYQGDILVTDAKTFFKQGMNKRPLVVGTPKYWPDGVIPYVIEEGLPNRADVQKAIAYLNKMTNVQFVPRKNEAGYVFIKEGNNNCYANLGYKKKRRLVVLEKNCQKREILHELMHILGFFHEHCREDRDKHLIVVWDNIDKKYHDQFKKIPESINPTRGLEFDFQSIMLYGPDSFSLYPDSYSITTINGDIYQINSSEGLSSGDIKKINLVY